MKTCNNQIKMFNVEKKDEQCNHLNERICRGRWKLQDLKGDWIEEPVIG